MGPLSIQVSGNSTIIRHPERAVLSATVRSESPEKEIVSSAVTSTSNELHAVFTQLSPKTESGETTSDAPIAVFSSTSLSTSFSSGYNNNGEPTGPVHHASVSYSVHFRDFSKLSEIVAVLATYATVEIDSIEWRLTDETKKSFASESRKLAMQDAIRKANDYAEVIGRKVVPTEICEDSHSDYQMSHVFNMPSMSARPPRVCQPMMAARTAFEEPESRDVMDMTPQDIKLTGSVSVKFMAVDDV